MSIYELPLPPTTNNLYFNLPKGGRAKTSQYTAWITEAGWEIARQRRANNAKKFTVPVSLLYEVKKTRRDLGNTEKAVSDLLVRQGVIEDDGPQYVSEIVLRWADVSGVRVTITPSGERSEPDPKALG
jgi:crossover junction endodeoxyribonuclease RusA